jgi:hypothetical protein
MPDVDLVAGLVSLGVVLLILITLAAYVALAFVIVHVVKGMRSARRGR